MMIIPQSEPSNFPSDKPRDRMVRLELLHAVGAIERVLLLVKGEKIEADVARLLEMARATVGLT